MKPIHKNRKIENLKDMINQSAQLFENESAYKFKTDIKGQFNIITFKELKEHIDCLGTALINMGLKNKRIAIISENRYEWAVSYLAISSGVGVVVPLDKSLPDIEIENLIKRSEVEAIFYSNKYDNIMRKIKYTNSYNVKYFISMDLEKEENTILSQYELMRKGKKQLNSGDNNFILAQINNEDVSFMLFTSGTTAEAKAVMLSHKNICSNLMDIASVIKLSTKDTLLSFLPLHHTFECTVGFLYPLYVGSSIAFSDGIRHMAENIKEYEITAMISVPALYENIYNKIMRGIEKKGKLKQVNKGIKLCRFLLKFKIDIRKKVFKDIHQELGEKARLFVSGGAALDKYVEQGFNELGFKIVQGYGLTETSPVIAAGNDKYTKIGSIGKIFPSLCVKIDNVDDEGIGEIIVKGPSVMIGYYNNEEETEKVLKNGWFYTGDLGYIDNKGFLYITGRKKSVIVLKNGKNIFPEELELVLNKIPGVKESFVYGKLDKDDDTKICCKIVYDKDIVKDVYDIIEESNIYDALWNKIKEINKTMPPYKYIREMQLTQEELVKTTTQKIKRHAELAKTLKK